MADLTTTANNLLEDARRLLRGWPESAIEGVWASLRAAVGAWKLEYDNSPGLDAADWIEKLSSEGYLPLADLLADIRVVEAQAGRRSTKPLPRLYAVVVLKAVSANDTITALKAIVPVRESLEQARRRTGATSADIVTRMATAYLRANPDARNRQVFEHVQGMAVCHDLFSEPDEVEAGRRRGAVLDYLPHRAARESKLIDAILFSKRMHKIRRRLGLAGNGKKFLG